MAVVKQPEFISFRFKIQIGHFIVVYSVTRPMNGSEAAGDLVLTSCKLCCYDANKPAFV